MENEVQDTQIVDPKSEKTELSKVKSQIKQFVAVRGYIKAEILPLLEEGRDYYSIKDRKSLGKPGAEKLAAFYNLVATFELDKETQAQFSQKDTVFYVCNLHRGNELRGQGRGVDSLARNQNDPNKTVKMAQKRAYVDAVIRATGLSDMFTQDLEDMGQPEQPKPVPATYNKLQPPMTPVIQGSMDDVLKAIGGMKLKHEAPYRSRIKAMDISENAKLALLSALDNKIKSLKI